MENLLLNLPPPPSPNPHKQGKNPHSSLSFVFLSLQRIRCFLPLPVVDVFLSSLLAGVLLQLPPHRNCQIRISAQLQWWNLAPAWSQEWLRRSICLRCSCCYWPQRCLGNRICLWDCGTEWKDGTRHDDRGLVKIARAWHKHADCENAGLGQSAKFAGSYGAGWDSCRDVHSMLMGGRKGKMSRKAVNRVWMLEEIVCKNILQAALFMVIC